MGKKSLLLGAAIGYVLGARAGRKRYDQIAAATARLWNDPKVKSKVDKAQTAAVDTAKSAAASAKDAVVTNDKVQATVQAAKDKLPGSHGSAGTTPTTSPTAAGTATGTTAGTATTAPPATTTSNAPLDLDQTASIPTTPKR